MSLVSSNPQPPRLALVQGEGDPTYLSEDDAHDIECAMHAAETGQATVWPIVADVLRLEVLRLRAVVAQQGGGGSHG